MDWISASLVRLLDDGKLLVVHGNEKDSLRPQSKTSFVKTTDSIHVFLEWKM